MKTAWLPEMPIHVSTLLLDPRLAHESDAKIGRLIRVMARAWIDGELRSVPPSILPLAESFWPDYAALREKLHAKHRALSDAGSLGGRPKSESQAKSQAFAKAKSPAKSRAETTQQQQQQQPEPESLRSSGSRRAPRDTWLTPFGTAWRERYGGEPPWGRLGSALAELCERHGAERVLVAWGRYLLATEGEFASPQRFASTFGRWDGTAPAPQKLDAPRQNVPPPVAAPDPEFRARYEESMRRRRAPRCALGPAREAIAVD